LRGRALPYTPHNKRDGNAICDLSRLHIRGGCAGEQRQYDALYSKYRRRIKRKDKIRQRDGSVHGNRKAVALPSPTFRACAAAIRPQQRIIGNGMLSYGEHSEAGVRIVVLHSDAATQVRHPHLLPAVRLERHQ